MDPLPTPEPILTPPSTYSTSHGLDPLRISSWTQQPWLLHAFSTRPGGVSSAYGPDDLNLGWVKDDPAASVAENRRRFLSAAAANQPVLPLITARQIHSAIVHTIRQEDDPFAGTLMTPEGKAVLEGDGLITNVAGLFLGVITADCVPILIADPVHHVVGAFHAGWRGTAAKIVGKGIEMMQRNFGSRVEDLIAAIGPSIGPCCYAVGEEVITQFSANFPYSAELFSIGDLSRLDLWQANRRQLLESGIPTENIALTAQCTACFRDPQGRRRFFSHRAEQGFTGRMLSVIGVAPHP